MFGSVEIIKLVIAFFKEATTITEMNLWAVKQVNQSAQHLIQKACKEQHQVAG